MLSDNGAGSRERRQLGLASDQAIRYSTEACNILIFDSLVMESILTRYVHLCFSAAITAAVALSLAGCAGSKVGPDAIAGQTPSATVELQAVQAAYIGSASGGSGTLFYNGRSYPFSIGGAGIGGIGASTVEGYGEVYKLNDMSQFPGAYAQGRYGFALGNKSGGDLWLQNGSGVIIHIKAKREGLMLSLGGDAMVISFQQ
jgi:hypothetical protein